MTRDTQELRTAKMRLNAAARPLTLVATGLSALALVAVSAQMLWQPAPQATLAAASDVPRSAGAQPAASGSPAPQVWLASLNSPQVTGFAAHDYADEAVFPRRTPQAARPPIPAAPAADASETAAPEVVAAPEGSLLTRGERTTSVPVPAPAQIILRAPRAVPPPRPQVVPQPDAVATDEPPLDAQQLAALRAPTHSPTPRARPFTPQVADTAPAQTQAAPGQIVLASLGGDTTSLIRSRLPQPRPEAVTRLASASLDTPQPTAPRAQAPAPSLSVPPLTSAIAGQSDRCESNLTRAIPRRARNAGDGSSVIGRLTGSGGGERDNAVISEVLAGNIPDFLRDLVPVTFNGTGASGQPTRVTICVTPDYLAVGSDSDFVRVPLGLPAAMRVAERFDMVLPTTRMVDAIYQQAAIHLSPAPMEPNGQMASTNYFLRHNATVEGQRRQAGGHLGQLVSGHKKDLVLTNRLQSHPGRVAIYGWHRRNGQAIQPLSTVHGAQYADYSHGIRLVARRAYVNGRAVDLRDLLSDSRLAGLVSAEGTISNRQLLALAD
ncbi:hypothetical protein [Pararhodobacter zhoushanensis]|uniref:hypothetical protein n=1 Tax=Pararhodobacter zhoushanensis TaxID=2479545 RepID=UPI0013E084C9|nr:hypothetical protein [Pararhodobacter zhoushanensis]